MALTFSNYGRGDTNAVAADFTTGSVFGLAEPVALVSNKVVPASAFTWTTDLATTRTNFKAALFGASLQQHISTTSGQVYANGTANKLTVGTTGEYWANISGTAVAFGDLVGPAKNPSSNALLPQTVEKVSSGQEIGTATWVSADGTYCLYRLKPTLISPA